MIARLLSITSLLLVFAPMGWSKDKFVTGFIEILADGGCELNKKPMRCDRVPKRLRAMRLSPGFSVMVAVDDAPYESVEALLDSLHKNGIKDVFLMPPFLGTNPSKSTKHWIKFAVDGEINHPFQMPMISTERFKTWRENLIVLPPPEFAIVDGLATERIGQADCVKSAAQLPLDLARKEYRLFIFEHSDDLTHSCLLPRAATSCEFLSATMSLANVGWGKGDLDAIRAVAGEIGCSVKQ